MKFEIRFYGNEDMPASTLEAESEQGAKAGISRAMRLGSLEINLPGEAITSVWFTDKLTGYDIQPAGDSSPDYQLTIPPPEPAKPKSNMRRGKSSIGDY